ncbi:MAG TPA: hypothetical protein VGJ82_15250 [Thermoanaerobaculia bacterium]|jgi:hypothetical protein
MLIFTAADVSAEERCLPTDTPRQCVQRLITTRAYENAQAALAATNPGTSTVASPIRSAVKDFLSAGSAHVDHSSVKDSGTALIIDYNFVKQINLEATFPDPAPSPAAAAGTAVQQLSRGDDVLATLSYNLLTRRFGRNVDRSLFDSMLLAVISNAAPATGAVPVTSYDTPFQQLFPEVAPRVTAMAEYEAAALAALPAVANQLGTDLKDLANRQPQIFASGLYRRRASAVGPDEHGIRLTWEIGTGNVNTFRREEGHDCETRGDCLAAFTNFTARTAKAHRLGRLALAIQFGKTALNDAGTYSEVATRGFTYLATYGQEISGVTGQPARFDVSYTYDGKKAAHTFTTSGTAVPPRRGSPSATAVFSNGAGGGIPPSSIPNALAFTFTQPVARNLSAPLSVVRVTHDDWLPGACVPGPAPDPIASPVSSPVPLLPDPILVCTGPTHRRHSEIEYHLALRYQLPPFPHPPQSPSCCCK